MNESGIAKWLHQVVENDFIVMHICVLVTGLLISSSGFALLTL